VSPRVQGFPDTDFEESMRAAAWLIVLALPGFWSCSERAAAAALPPPAMH